VVMLIAWMGYATLVTSIVWVGALAAERVVGLWHGPRRFVWLAAVLASMIAPVTLATRTTPAPSTPRSRVTSFAAPPGEREHLTIAGSAPRRVNSHRTDVSGIALRAAAVSERYAAAVWTVASIALFLFVILTMLRIGYRRRRWREVQLDGMHVLVAPNVGPAVIGTVRPRVVIPTWSLALDDRARALMLRHEAEHIRAR